MASGWDKDTARHSMAKKFGKAPPYRNKANIKVIKTATGYKLAKDKWREGIDFAKGYLNERQILLLKRRLNHDKLKSSDLSTIFDKGGIKITPAQTQKGLEWLNDQWKTPSGAERKNNPFRTREQDVLETFQRFELTDFYDAGNTYFHSYQPVYSVIGKQGSFDYYVAGGKMHIIG